MTPAPTYQPHIQPGGAQGSMETVIDIRELRKSFDSNHVLRGVDLKVNKGEIVTVLGRSGTGKSVLIKCMVGLIIPDSGSLLILGEEVTALQPDALDALRVRLGFLFQSNALYDSMTIRENLAFPLRRHRKDVSEEEENSLILEALENVGLAHTVDMMPADLSGGMRKRVALARTLILRPEIILYDEPTTGLDPLTSREITHLIVDVQAKYNATSIVISHDMNCVRLLGGRIVMLIDGRCYAEGSFEELKRSADPKVKVFFEE